MSMKDFHAWVQAGNFDKPTQLDNEYATRLQPHNRTMLETIEKITGERTSQRNWPVQDNEDNSLQQ